MGTITFKDVETRKNNCLNCVVKDAIITNTRIELDMESEYHKKLKEKMDMQKKDYDEQLNIEKERAEKYKKLYKNLKKMRVADDA